jgi:hypothetical protein
MLLVERPRHCWYTDADENTEVIEIKRDTIDRCIVSSRSVVPDILPSQQIKPSGSQSVGPSHRKVGGA